MKKNLLMLCSLVAFAIGASGVANALQAGVSVRPASVICIALGILGFVGNALRGRAKPGISDS
ncbi:hypothetical protein [Burkholderia ambifaria]|uniref:hypothetical protein n=1 Tax=Burkholderia ambifaria TaxID=152480 RepID=UPI00158DC8C5|nr:hypothetical protein [Burkholderia ambifaria]